MNMNDHLKIIERSDDSSDKRAVYSFVGEMDKAGLDIVRKEVSELVDAFEKDLLVFDFKEMKFTNSEGIGFLMEIHAHLVNVGKNLVICDVRENVMDVFEAIGLDKVVKIYDDLSNI